MEQIGVIRSGNSVNVNVKKKFISFFKKTESLKKNEVSSEFLDRKPSLQIALINNGSTLFMNSPLKERALEEILFDFSVRYDNDNKKLEEIEIAPDKRIKNWKKYLEKFENEKVDDFFIVLENGNLKLGNEGVAYLKNIIEKYETDVAVA